MSCYFYLLYCLLDMNCECNVISLYFLCFSVNGSVCFVCCVSDRVCKLFGETIYNIFWFPFVLLGLFMISRF